ncbi:delta(3,5)-Delta(2,4)-dienoyl-CoA isomerase, mitochondrial [Thrips palmi]|uniref:Delta(3,5)-Delta(2,4)-dienoyl-CoA isomerase, mitochondrial n=1 Tax=Thrips palmi TaxID=161013 RepID=A0A6P8ZPG4_THRPL|nr:delta(3,5)-Delta(2,4)-dienoyl-CoA isomerase, mitochondrial [Thrips palmi]XP_034244060.1 delta(3,5)-Delta(2,4)-dienoyl-CoA isomerase, mitochondrial [Thrips palmi]
MFQLASRLARSTGGMSLLKRNCSSSTIPQYETLAVTVHSPFVYHVELNRPDRLNAMNGTMWREVGEAFRVLADDKDCRVVVLSGAGRAFTAGLDLSDPSVLMPSVEDDDDIARRCQAMHRLIRRYQDSVTSLEKCLKPVICAMNGPCVGAGVDIASTADIRLCSSDSWFQIKEVAIGLAADVGTLQRLPKAIGSRSLVNELALTARKFLSAEAKECGFVSGVFPDKESLMKAAFEMAASIAAMSPVAVQMTKRSLVFSRDHTVDESLEHIASWNQALLQSDDLMKSAMAAATKSPPPTFSKL